jgi:hypothetical protein
MARNMPPSAAGRLCERQDCKRSWPDRHRSPCGDTASDRGMAGAADCRGVSVGDGSRLSGARQRWCVRPGVQAAGSRDGDPRPTDLTAITVAEPIRGTPDRNAPARLPGSRCHLRRAASPADPGRIYRLLQSDADASVVEQGCAVRSRGPATGSNSRCADFVRAASLLRADMIFGKDNRFPPWVNLDGSRMFATRPLHLRSRPVRRARQSPLP